MNGWFITGTDTGVGKTLIACGLLHALSSRGRVLGVKPVASGCRETPAGLRSDDALALLEHSNVRADYAAVNPYAFAPAVAPHLAARRSGITIELEKIKHGLAQLRPTADFLVVEGVGGWCVPLGPGITTADLAVTLGLPVVLVVGMRLGCLNHALLTADAIAASGLALSGWIANQIDPQMEFFAENIEALTGRLAARCWGVIPFDNAISTAHIAVHLQSHITDVAGC